MEAFKKATSGDMAGGMAMLSALDGGTGGKCAMCLMANVGTPGRALAACVVGGGGDGVAAAPALPGCTAPKCVGRSEGVLVVAVLLPSGSLNDRDVFGSLLRPVLPLFEAWINDNPDILPAHTIKCDFAEVGGVLDEPKTLREMIRLQTKHGANISGWVGPFEYSPCKYSQTLLRAYNQPQISYGCTAAELNDKTIMPLFARTVPSEGLLARAFLLAAKRFGWTRAGLIYTEDSSPRAKRFVQNLNGQVKISKELVVKCASARPELLKLAGERINIFILVSHTPNDLRMWLLDAFDLNMIGPGWLYIGGGVYDLTWLAQPGGNSCHPTGLYGAHRLQDALAAVEGAVFLNPAPPSMDVSGPFGQLVLKAMTHSNGDRAENGHEPINAAVWMSARAVYIAFLWDALLAMTKALHAEYSERPACFPLCATHEGVAGVDGRSVMKHVFGGMNFEGMAGPGTLARTCTHALLHTRMRVYNTHARLVAFAGDGDNLHPWIAVNLQNCSAELDGSCVKPSMLFVLSEDAMLL